MNAKTTEPCDLFAKLTNEGDSYLVHPMTDKGRAWFAENISDARGFTYVLQKHVHALVIKRAGDAGLRTMIDCGIGLPPADVLAHLPANIADYLRTANQTIPLLATPYRDAMHPEVKGVTFSKPK